MSGELTAETVTAVLRGKDASQVLGLFEELRHRGQEGRGQEGRGQEGRGQESRAITLPPADHEWLDGIGGITDDLVVRFLDLVWEYPSFDPPLDADDRRIESLEAVLRHGGHRAGFHLALMISIQSFPSMETGDLLLLLSGRGVEGEQETEAARWLVSNLLDHPDTRADTVRALSWMRDREDLAPVAAYVRPQLEPAEIAELDS